MSDSPDFVFDTGAAGEPVDEDDVQDTDDRPPAPAPAPVADSDPISDMITARWLAYQDRFPRASRPFNPAETNFAAWGDINKVYPREDRQEFKLSQGLRVRIKTERSNSDDITEVECFQKMSTHREWYDVRACCGQRGEGERG